MNEPFPGSVEAQERRRSALARLLGIVDRLRAPDGCPWDRAQTLETIAPHLVEEASELLEAVEAGGDEAVIEEAGDLLMGVALLARVGEEQDRFDIGLVAEKVSDKLIRRHPHVFGDAVAGDAAAALGNWEAVKREERRAKDAKASALDGVPRNLPALQRIRRLGEKAIAAGFRWSDPARARDKVAEELAELLALLGEGEGAASELSGERRELVEQELGDLLLACGLLGVYLGVDPERAARSASRRFEARFRFLERELGGELASRPPHVVEQAWERAKQAVQATHSRTADPNA